MLHGVDVSNWQPNWAPSSSDRYAFILTSDGHGWKSPTHDAQAALARRHKLVVGHYHWLRPGNIQAQAEWFVRCAQPRPGDVLVCDWEQSGTTNRDKDDWLRAVKKLCPNNRVILYCNTNYWRNYDRTSYTCDGLWIAAYGVSDPGIQFPWKFWQYADHPNTDQNTARFGSVSELKAWANMTAAPAPKPAPKPQPKPQPVPAPPVAPVPAAPAGLGAVQQPTRHRSKPQQVKPTKHGDHRILYLDDHGNVSWAFGAGDYEVTSYIRFKGTDANGELLVQAAIVDTDHHGKPVHTHYMGAVGLPGGGGTSFRQFTWRDNVPPAPKGLTRRLRLAVQNYTGKPLTITDIYTYAWKA